MKVKYSVEIKEQPGVCHIPGVCAQGGAVTLCAWVDVPHEVHDVVDYPISCSTCLNVLREVKALKL